MTRRDNNILLLIIAAVLFVFPFKAVSQTVISGNVKNSKGEFVVATVTVQSQSSVAISGFTSTNDAGNYSLTYKGTADSIKITVSGINIGKHQKTVINRSAQVDFIIEEKPLMIKEATVAAQKIQQTGDTLNYAVGAYTEQTDRVIGDALKKMPGIEVEDNGRIKYNGREINNVEDMDLLQGRYGIAVNNIPANHVSTVQILENHQPIKALKDRVFSENAAINLKLKDKAKGTISINALAGTGYEPILWQSELVAMYFAGKMQNMSMYKSNNVGYDVAGEFKTHYDYERIYMNPSGMLSVQMPSSPPIALKRYFVNNSHAATFNHLLKLNKDFQLNVSALYYADYTKKNSYSLYEQYLPNDSTLDIEERINSTSRIHNAEIAARLNLNTNNNYINNALNIKGNWDSDNGVGTTRSRFNNINESISQYLYKPFFSADYTFSLIKNFNDNFYSIYFSVGYGNRPHSLTVKPVNYFNHNDLSAAKQNATLRDFASAFRISYGMKIKKINADYAVWGRADIKNMDTELQYITTANIKETTDSLKNNIYYNTYQTGINQNYSYKTNIFRATLNIPLTYNIFTTDDRIPDNFQRHRKLTFYPSLSLSYDLTGRLTISTSGRINKSFGGINSSYTGYIMQNYRNLQKNTFDKLFETNSKNINTSLTYRDAFISLFINASIGYNWSTKNLLYGYDYLGILSMKTTIDKPAKTDGYNVNFNMSKGLSFMSGTLRLSGGYSNTNSDVLIQNEILNYRSQGYNARGSINCGLFSFFAIDYSLGWNMNKNYVIDKQEYFPAIRGLSQSLKIGMNFTKTLSAHISGEYTYNSATTERSTTFADAGLKLKTKKYDFELELNNMFNSKYYISASYSDISAYYYKYNLRPRSILIKLRFKLL
ncbi:MAG: hypothetical protein LBP63_11185 [Prevotellaceae bacterium]|jgi:hypothetical protein|nr:hypothetical protein [Prevotellaceae bacterium]